MVQTVETPMSRKVPLARKSGDVVVAATDQSRVMTDLDRYARQIASRRLSGSSKEVADNRAFVNRTPRDCDAPDYGPSLWHSWPLVDHKRPIRQVPCYNAPVLESTDQRDISEMIEFLCPTVFRKANLGGH